jgi:hypothetical protein
MRSLHAALRDPACQVTDHLVTRSADDVGECHGQEQEYVDVGHVVGNLDSFFIRRVMRGLIPLVCRKSALLTEIFLAALDGVDLCQNRSLLLQPRINDRHLLLSGGLP